MITKIKSIAARFPKGFEPLCVIIVIIAPLILFVSFFSYAPLSLSLYNVKKLENDHDDHAAPPKNARYAIPEGIFLRDHFLAHVAMITQKVSL